VARAFRLEHSIDLLAKGRQTLDAIASELGFSDGTALSRSFKERYGVPPCQYRPPPERAPLADRTTDLQPR